MARKPTNWKQVVVDYLYDKDRGICQLCKRAMITTDRFHIDHIVPVIEGGTDDLYNLRLVHIGCHVNRHFPQKKEAGIKRTIKTFGALNDQAARQTIQNAVNFLKQGSSVEDVYDKVGLTRARFRVLTKNQGLPSNLNKLQYMPEFNELIEVIE